MSGTNTNFSGISYIIQKKLKELFYDNLIIIVSDFQNNDKHKFLEVIYNFVKK